MKKLYLFYWSMALCAGLSMTACSSDDSDSIAGGFAVVTGDPNNMDFAAFSGTVNSSKSWGGPAPLGNVSVTTGTEARTTDANGLYRFDKVNTFKGRAVMRYEKEGYMSVVRTVVLADQSRLDVDMVEIESEAEYSSEEGARMSVGSYGDQVEVELPNSYQDEESGEAYSGTILAEAVYLDPDDENFALQMPGDLRGIRMDSSEVQLISYGMVAITFTGADGKKLEMAEGKTMTLKFPIPTKYTGNAPAEIPLWYFDEERALWVEEGVATLQGNVYVGEVSRYSWHSIDIPVQKASVTVNVKDSKGNALAFVPIDIDGQYLLYTDEKGTMKYDVPSQTDLKIRIPSESYGDYTANNNSAEQSQTINLNGGESKTINFTLPYTPVISGGVANSKGSNICSVYIIYNYSEKTKPVMSDVKGAFRIYAPTYRGEAKLVARFDNGETVEKDFTITDDDQRIDLIVQPISSTGTGMMTIKSDRLNLNITQALPTPSDGSLWPATIENGSFSVYGNSFEGNGEKEEEQNRRDMEFISFSIENFEEGKTTYVDGATFYYMKEGGPHFSLNTDYQKKATAEVILRDGVYTIKMVDIPALFSDEINGISSEEVKATIEFKATPQ